MENFIVSARKYRPATFNTVVGQDAITGTLKNAIKNNQLAQAFLFCGPRGVGKTTCARILAKTINCQNITADTEACDQCDSCLSFNKGGSMNIHELDAASNNSVDDIRSLVDQVRYPPQSGKYKIYIIDEVHMLSQSAFNAFLKTLEEPPPYAIFILATTEKHKIIPTILSRCQIFDFSRIKPEATAKHLAEICVKEGITYEEDGLYTIAQKADGALRDALSRFDQIVSFSGRNITYKAVIDNLNILDYDYYFKLCDALQSADIASSLLIFDDILNKGFDGNNFINGLGEHFRNLLVCKDPSTIKLLEVSEGIKLKYQQQSGLMSASFLLSALSIANQCDINYKASKNQRLHVELALIKMCHISSVLNLANLPEEDKKKTSEPSIKKSEPATEAIEANLTSEIPVSEPEIEKTLPVPSIPEKKVIPLAKSSASDSIRLPSLQELDATYQKPIIAPEENNDSTEPTEIIPLKTAEVSPAQLSKIWNEYITKMKADGKTSFYMLLEAQQLDPQNNIIRIVVENKVQIEMIQEEKTELLGYIREQSGNYAFDIEIIEPTNGETVRKLYTSSDKFKFMAEKNPKLLDLKKRLDLDLEY